MPIQDGLKLAGREMGAAVIGEILPPFTKSRQRRVRAGVRQGRTPAGRGSSVPVQSHDLKVKNETIGIRGHRCGPACGLRDPSTADGGCFRGI
jgi:hypothetical protein